MLFVGEVLRMRGARALVLGRCGSLTREIDAFVGSRMVRPGNIVQVSLDRLWDHSTARVAGFVRVEAAPRRELKAS